VAEVRGAPATSLKASVAEVTVAEVRGAPATSLEATARKAGTRP
jgi:hypothetical protein